MQGLGCCLGKGTTLRNKLNSLWSTYRISSADRGPPEEVRLVYEGNYIIGLDQTITLH